MVLEGEDGETERADAAWGPIRPRDSRGSEDDADEGERGCWRGDSAVFLDCGPRLVVVMAMPVMDLDGEFDVVFRSRGNERCGW